MHYYRLIENRPGRTPLGYGMAPGRWNHSGTPIIYACSHISINFVELMSIKGSYVSHAEWLLVTIAINIEPPMVQIDSLPDDWTKRPYPMSTQNFGTKWAEEMISPCLKVPSCRIPVVAYPNEHNLLINPVHPDARETLDLVSVEKVHFAVNL